MNCTPQKSCHKFGINPSGFQIVAKTKNEILKDKFPYDNLI